MFKDRCNSSESVAGYQMIRMVRSDTTCRDVTSRKSPGGVWNPGGHDRARQPMTPGSAISHSIYGTQARCWPAGPQLHRAADGQRKVRLGCITRDQPQPVDVEQSVNPSGSLAGRPVSAIGAFWSGCGYARRHPPSGFPNEVGHGPVQRRGARAPGPSRALGCRTRSIKPVSRPRIRNPTTIEARAVTSRRLAAQRPPGAPSLLATSGVMNGRPPANTSRKDWFTKAGAPRM